MKDFKFDLKELNKKIRIKIKKAIELERSKTNSLINITINKELNYDEIFPFDYESKVDKIKKISSISSSAAFLEKINKILTFN